MPTLLSFSRIPREGGAFHLMTRRLVGLAERGWEVHLASRDVPALAAGHRELEAVGGQVHFLDKDPRRPLATNPRLGWLHLLRRVPAPLVEFHRHVPEAGWLEILLTRLMGRRAVAVDHVPPLPEVVGWRVRLATRACVRDLVGSQASADLALAQATARAEQLEVLPCSLPPRAAPGPEEVAALRAELALGEGPVLLALAAHYEWQKGLRTLIEAMVGLRPRFPGLVLLLAGDGPDSPGYRQLVTTRGLAGTVRFLGWRHDGPALLRVADRLVHPSRFEAGLCLSVLEALDAGCPLVVSDTPYHQPLQAAGVATLVPLDDVEALAAGIRESLEGDRSAQVEAGRSFVEAYRSGPVLDRLDRLYRSLL